VVAFSYISQKNYSFKTHPKQQADN
jgi:hypothetical protein